MAKTQIRRRLMDIRIDPWGVSATIKSRSSNDPSDTHHPRINLDLTFSCSCRAWLGGGKRCWAVNRLGEYILRKSLFEQCVSLQKEMLYEPISALDNVPYPDEEELETCEKCGNRGMELVESTGRGYDAFGEGTLRCLWCGHSLEVATI